MYKSRMKRLKEQVSDLEKRVIDLENTPLPKPSLIKIEVSCMSIGENIKNRRKAFGMTQEKLADTVGINRSMVAQIERGTKSVTLRLAADMAKVLQCDVNDFLNEKEE